MKSPLFNKISRALQIIPVTLLSAITAGNVFAVMPPDRPELPNFDHRPGAAAKANANRLAEPQARLRASIPGVRVDWDDIVGTPKWIASPDGFLSGANGKGRGISTAVAARFALNEPHRTTKAFLEEHRVLFGHGAEVLDNAHVKRDFVTPHNGMRTVVWEQQLDGIPVFEGLLISHTTKNGELVNLSSHFLPDAARAAAVGTPNRAQVQRSPPISAQEAVAFAAKNLGEKLGANEVAAVDAQPIGTNNLQRFRVAPLSGETEVKLVWLPTDGETMRLCWEVVLTSRIRGEMFRLIVDAQTGDLWVRHGLTEYLSDATYRVYISDSPSPFSPGHPAPLTNQPPLVERALATISALNTNASPSGWINYGVNETRGNNVDAHTDRDANDSPDLPRPHGSPFRVFDFAMALSQPPTYSAAAVVQLFYWCNWMHDKLYELGFTEAAGNFQDNNFGRGGLGNDAVQADAQDGNDYNNANISIPPDGSSPRIQMFLFTGPDPWRDADFDAEVILHEYTHGLSHRRVGGGVGISALQTAGMGEGWSDFYALALLSEPGDDVNGVYATGGYITYLLGGMMENYYFGIRRYPYCTDLNKNPLTFKDIDPSQASTHPGIPRSPIIDGTANEVHNMGEVWCVTLWEARANLINKYGWFVGNQLMLQLVTDGMNLSPANPNFLQARDAIIQADQVLTGGANKLELWAAFAKRGMGLNAISPASWTTAGVVGSFDQLDDLQVTPGTGLTAMGFVGGPFNPAAQDYTLLNAGTNSLDWAASTTAAWLTLSSLGGNLPSTSSLTVTASLSAAASDLPSGIYTASAWFTNLSSGARFNREFTLKVIPREMNDDFEPDIDWIQWSVVGGSFARIKVNNWGGSVSGSNSLWVGSYPCFICLQERYAASLPLNTLRGGSVEFFLRFGSDPDSSTWNRALLPKYGVVLEYSTDSGTNWVEMGRFDTADYYDWTEVLLEIPPEAQASATQFRWRQLGLRYIGFTHANWALDDVRVKTSPQPLRVGEALPRNLRTCVGQTATFTAGTIGVRPFFYQWQFNGTNIPGATNATLTLAKVQQTDAGSYRVLVSNAASENAISSAATLTIVPSLVVAWGGYNEYGETDVPFLTNAVAVAGGWYHSLALRDDGTVVAWGEGKVWNPPPWGCGYQYGQSLVPGGLTDVKAIAADNFTSLALQRDGNVVAWGARAPGPAVVFTNVVAIDGHADWIAALTSGGDVFEWTDRGYIQRYGLQNMVAIAQGCGHGLALKADGTVAAWVGNGVASWGWDGNDYGQCDIPQGLMNVVAIAAGLGESLALRADGTVVAWGARTDVPMGLTNVVAIAAGGDCNYALKSDGTLVYWPTGGAWPDTMPAGLRNVCAIGAGRAHGMAVINGGSPTVHGAPVNWAVPQGADTTFSARVSGMPPLSYQWRLNGGDIPSATDINHTINNAQPGKQGNYSVVVTNAFGSVTSSIATLTIIPDPLKPTVTLTSPPANAPLTEREVMLSGNAADAVQLAQVLYKQNGSSYGPVAVLTHLTPRLANWSTPLTLVPGTNTVWVKSVDLAGNESSEAKRSFFFQVPGALNIILDPQGSGIVNCSSPQLFVGRDYQIAATPVDGNWLFSNWLASADGGQATVVTKEATYTFLMQSNLTLTANFVTNGFIEAAGNYYGLFSETNSGVSHHSAGFFRLTVSSMLKFSGKLYVDGQVKRFTGTFDVSGKGTSKEIVRTEPLCVTVQLALAGSGKVSGVVSNTAWVSAMSGYKAGTDAVVGQYTMVIVGSTNATESPAGDGYGLVTMQAGGTVKCNGKMVDGCRFVPVSASVSKDGDWPVYAPLYRGSGFLFGWLRFTNSPRRDLLDGCLSWIKTATPTDVFYPAGFTNQSPVLGSAYDVPPLGTRAMDLLDGMVVVRDGNLSAPFANHVVLNTDNKFTVLPPNVNLLKSLQVVPLSGQVKGRFTHPAKPSVATKIVGVVLQEEKELRGGFLGTTQTGAVRSPGGF